VTAVSQASWIRVVLAAVVLASCASPRAARPRADGAPDPTLYETQRRITEYIDSGRYDADVARVVDAAQAWVEARAPQVTRPAIVLDIDETSLSNWRAYRLNGWSRIKDGGCDLDHGPCGIRAWQTMHLASAIAPTRRLAARARELGVAVFFVTGRPSHLRAATEQNLREQGFTWDGVVLAPDVTEGASAADFKAPARRRLVEQGYTILLAMGDQQSDLDGGSAERTFKLPNPVYFLP
jgi:acid phosphatase